MSIQNVFVAFTAFLAVANGHMIMANPVPFNNDTIDNSPITRAQFPCKRNPNTPFTVSQMNNMAVGTKQELSFTGSAVHGGGSCQLSITIDTDPNENSVFKVIKSIEGGCPGVEDKKTYDFELPASIPNGKATFAWTWFSKLSGQPELYMNCAPIEVTGGASDKTAFNALPNMLVANLDETCKSVPNFSVAFPDPGSVVEKGAANDQKPPTGTGCGKSSGGSPAQPAQPSSGPSQAPSAPQSYPVAQPSSPAAAPKPSSPPSNPGGAFAPGASSAAAPALTSTTLVTVTAVPTPAKPAPSGNYGAAPAQPPAASAPSAPSSGGASDKTCSTDGALVCNSEKQFGLCNHGKIVWQDVAAGTACVNGIISKRSIARSPRYRSPHARRAVF